MNARHSGAAKLEERPDMAKIVTQVKLGFELRPKIEDKIKSTLSRLGIPIANIRGQIHLLLDNTEGEVSDLRVPVEYIEQARDALTDALETNGLKAEINRAGNEIEIKQASAENPRKAIGY